MWAVGLHVAVHRKVRRRFAVVPCRDGRPSRARSTASTGSACIAPTLDETRDCDAVVADFSADLPAEWERFLADAALDGRMVYQVKQLSESLTGRVEVDHLSENSFGNLMPGARLFPSQGDDRFHWSRWSLLPILAAADAAASALAIRLDSRGPALFRQRRLGLAGKPITVYKFRTMKVHDAGDDERSRGDDRRQGRPHHPARRLPAPQRIDELPQIINILKGEMSWIGPRPEALVLSNWYVGEIPFYRYRHVVRPGISGWAQVNQGHVAEVDEVHEKLQYDFFYIKYFSPWLDLLILFRTIKTMLTGFGSR